jgi:tRNA (cytidine/uridine-2'-O-)-methyltransferase
MFNVILYEPEIPPNTGNIMRLCANTGCRLHLIAPLGFDLDEKKLRRAGLDYRDWIDVEEHAGWPAFMSAHPGLRIFAATTRASQSMGDVSFEAGDGLLFGPETRGLPVSILEQLPREQLMRVPMQTDSRSLNLSNAVSVVVYEAWRQLGYANAAQPQDQNSKF